MLNLICDDKALAAHRRINQTGVPYPDGESVKELFERCADRAPDAVAVIHGDTVLTYRELNRQANVLAARLAESGLRAGEAVGVLLGRSPELIVALLAVVKCGAAYLPFDASWPAERIKALLDDANCTHVLSDPAVPSGDRFTGCRVLPVSGSDLTGEARNPATPVDPEDIAYINFTSGSTGRPKGVPIRHRSITRLVFGATYARLDENSRLLQLATASFDAATFEIWGALLHGGTCVLYPLPYVSLSELRQVLETHGVTVVFLTTALFNTIVDEAPQTLASVGTILTGGEAHSLTHIEKALQSYGPDRLVSVYGPTECTTFATYYPVRRLAADQAALPIGRPIQNTRAYVVEAGELCAPDQVGEVLLAGPGLSPGYLGRPEETRERFVEGEIDGVVERLYRTGDRAYLDDDGNLVFQGRLDDQVKINGFRIELGEVAHHLDMHPQVKQSFVTYEANAFSEKRLVAFAVPADEGLTRQSIRAFLRERLPGYMIPSDIELCASLPLSVTGKVDRSALLSARQARDADA